MRRVGSAIDGGAGLTFREYIGGLNSKRVTVIGAGISNTPLIEALLAANVDTTICDKRSRDAHSEEIRSYEERGAKLVLGERYLEYLDGDIIFRTPGLMPSDNAIVRAVANGACLTSEMEVFFDVCPCKIVAVTGSDGKTTVTSLIAELLNNGGYTVHVGGNIGSPLLCEADGFLPDDVAVLELSSFQLITMRKSPETAVFTNLSPNHLDVHSNMAEYLEAKRNIFAHQKSTDRAVFNLDNGYTRVEAASAPGEVLFFSRMDIPEDGVFLHRDMLYEATSGHAAPIMSADDVAIPGVHNLENIMAAFAAVKGLVSHDVMRETARTFRGVKHRIELVRVISGVRYYNDSIASSPTRAIAGLRAIMDLNRKNGLSPLERNIILLAGGKDKGAPFNELGEEITQCVKLLILTTGKAAQQIQGAVTAAPGYDGVPEILMRDDFSDAVLTAAGAAKEGDVVLLSPACTSFDRFRDFQERGDAFREIVNGLDDDK